MSMGNDVLTVLADARRAMQRGDLTQARTLTERAKALKKQPGAPQLAESLYPGRMGEGGDVRRWAQGADRVMEKAYKALATDDLTPQGLKLADELHDGDYARMSWEKQQAYIRYLRGVALEQIGAIAGKAVLSPARIEDAIALGMSASELKAVQVEAQDSAGGVLVAEVVSDRVMSRAAALSVVRPRAWVDVVGVGGSLGIPLVTGGDNTFTNAIRGQYMGEIQPISGLEENFRLGMVRPEVHLLRVRCKVSKSLQEDAGQRLVMIFEQQAAFWKAAREDKSFLVGTGAGEPKGILSLQSPGVLANGDITVVNSGNAVNITGDAVESTIYSVLPQYRALPGFCITCSTNTLRQIRLLKDGAGRYLFDDRDHTLLGFPLIESPSMPEIAANAFVLLCGDMEGYAIVDRIGMAIQRYEDSALADRDEMAFDIRVRVAGTTAQGWRFAALKVSN